MRSHGTWFNLIFVGYALLVQPVLLAATSTVLLDDGTNVVIGLLLSLAIVLETIGLFWKIPHVQARLGVNADTQTMGEIMMVWVLHTVLTVVLGIAAMQAFGISIDDGGWIPPAVMMGLVIKEIAVLGVLTMKPAKMYDRAKEIHADIALAIFACIAYTGFWEVLAHSFGSVFETYSGFEAYLQLSVSIFIFFIAFLPTRFGFFYEDALTQRTPVETMWWWVSMGLATLAGISPLIF